MLKKTLMWAHNLALLNNSGHITLNNDSCNDQIVCVLLQQTPDKTEKPVGYWSRPLADAERNFDTTQRECLALVRSVQLLRPYLEGTRFTIRTDHNLLNWVFHLTQNTGSLARCCSRLSEFESSVVYRASVKHQAPDALSRLPTTEEDQTVLNDNLPIYAIGARDGRSFDYIKQNAF